MLAPDSIEQAVALLNRGHRIARVTRECPWMDQACRVAGRLMGLSDATWWYLLLARDGDAAAGLLDPTLFLPLFDAYYLEAVSEPSPWVTVYTLNRVCDTGELPRYRHQLAGWQASTSTPGRSGALAFE